MAAAVSVDKKIALGLLLTLILCDPVKGQITSPAADAVDTLMYPVSNARDPLFVFHQPSGNPRAGSLRATLPGGGTYTFEWRKYNPDLDGFDAPFHTETGVANSSVQDLVDGGYQVRIQDASTTDTAFMAWVMLDHFRAVCEKTDDGLVKPFKYTCEFLVISGFVTADTLVYYDPVSHDRIPRPAEFSFRWTSDNEELAIPNDTTVLDPNITYLPPYEDTWYILTATDQYGMQDVDSVYYESIQTKAEFHVEYYDKVNDTLDADLTGEWSLDRGSLDARLTARFYNDSKNGETFEWVFLDTLGGIKENQITYSLDEWVEYTYVGADEYYDPYLVSTSEADCIDTFRLEEPIYVEPSQLEIPNVFSPNGDPSNPVWRFKHQSIKSCKVTIVDRFGTVVYKRDISDIYEWEGWDGNIRESDRQAPQGQYYYVVEAIGYDGEEYRDLNVFERWKANRGNNNTGGSQPPGGQGQEGTVDTRYVGWLYLFRGTGAF